MIIRIENCYSCPILDNNGKCQLGFVEFDMRNDVQLVKSKVGIDKRCPVRTDGRVVMQRADR